VVGSGARVLEAGCGLGSWVRFFHSRGLIPTGLDYSEPTVRRLGKSFPELDWVVGDVRRLPFEKETYDIVVSWGVIEHLEEGPIEALKEFHRVLKTGGFLFVSVPWHSPLRAFGGFAHNGNNLARLSDGLPRFSQYYMTEQELLDFTVGAGFSTLGIQPTSIHAKTLLPRKLRVQFPLLTKVFNRVLSPLLPKRLIASMILVTATKRAKASSDLIFDSGTV